MPITLIKKALLVWKNEGFDMVLFKIKLKFSLKNLYMKNIYKKWIAENESSERPDEKLAYHPFFSVVIPVYNVADHMLRECIDAVLCQTYQNFEVILVDDASTQASVRTVLKGYEQDPRVTVIYRTENGHISRATNDGIQAAKGEFVALCDCDDLYAPNALYEVAKKLNEDDTLDYIYSDEDKISENGKVRRDPFFKPDWSPETFMSYMYTCHLSVYRKTILEAVSGLRPGFEGSQDYDLVLRVMEQTDRIGHIPKILYHWRMRKESTANSMTAKPYVLEATARAKKEALKRRGEKGTLTLIPQIGQHRVTYLPQGDPLISIIIPSKDNPKMLERCLSSIEKHTDYKNYEIIVVDNGSSGENKKAYQRILQRLERSHAAKRAAYRYQPMEFNFAKMCNNGAADARGELLLFLNDDIEVSEGVKKNQMLQAPVSQWLSILAGQAQVSYTGAVGCKLYYPNGIQLQHAGILNLPIGPGHCLYGEKDNLNYYYGRNLLDYNFCAVTGACLMVARDKFEEAGGFEEALSVAYNDVALCFRLIELGYYNVLRNDVALVHHESVSRGMDDASRQKEARRKREMKKLYELYPQFAGGYDPCYNPNLTPDKGDFSFHVHIAYLPQKPVKAKGSALKRYRRIDPAKNILPYHFDFVDERADTVQVNGWAYDSRRANNNYTKATLFLKKDTGELYTAKTEKIASPKLQAAKGGARALSLAGFTVTFTKQGLPAGKYRIGIGLGQLYVLDKHGFQVN